VFGLILGRIGKRCTGLPMSDQEESREVSPIRIKWEVPLPWLLGAMFVIVGQAIGVYFSQQRQGEMLVEQMAAQKELLRQVKDLSMMISSNNVKDVEHDMKIADHERRLQAYELRQSK